MRGRMRAVVLRCGGAACCALLLPVCARVTRRPGAAGAARLASPTAASCLAARSPRRSRPKTPASSTTRATNSAPCATCASASPRKSRPVIALQLLGEVRLDQGRVLEAYGLYRARASVAGTALRHPGGPHSADVWRDDAHGLRQQQHPDRPAARLSVPRVDSAGCACRRRPTTCCACAAAAGSRPSRSATRPRRPACRMVNTSAWDTGVQVHGVTGIFEWTGAVTAGIVVGSAVSRQQRRPADCRARRRAAGGRQSMLGALAVARARGSIGRSRQAIAGQASIRSQRPDGDGRRCRVFGGPWLVRGEVIRSTWQMPRSSALAPRTSRWRPLDAGRGPLQDRAGILRGPARRTARLQHHHGRARRDRRGMPRPGASKAASAIR